MDILFGLNEQQKIIASKTEGAILVTAGAGSGKTRLLTHRICYLMQEKKVAPENILAITFTNKATNEMRERIEMMLPEGSRVWISTFHAMCVKILRDNISFLDGYTRFFTICDESDKEKLIKSILKDKDLFETDFKNTLIWHISNAKNKGLSPSEYSKEIMGVANDADIVSCYAKYEEELKRCNSLDFDDLLVKTFELFNKVPKVLEYYQNKFKYIHVDEFQDTNVVQYKLVRLLSAKYGNIFVVGDEDQCIYCWRGANIENIKNFIKDNANCSIFKLEQNYRSTKNILKSANMLIQNNTERLDKTLFTENEDGSAISYYPASTEIDEAEYVVRKISKLIADGVKPSEIGVLMRISALSRLIEEKLLNYNISYIVAGIFKFFDRAEIKNLLAYMRVIVNNADDISISRIINFPKRNIGNATIEKLQDYAKTKNKSLFDVITNYQVEEYPTSIKNKISDFANLLNILKENCEKMSLTSFVKFMIDKANIKESYDKSKEEDVDRLMNIDQFIQSVQSFENLNEDASVLSYLESVTLQNSIEEDDETNSISVSTVHASKGLEFDVVFVIGLEEGCFPLSRGGCGNIENLEEERRLMYVATTRAKKQLFITRAKSRFLYGNRETTVESRFIEEMGLQKPKENIYQSFSNSFNGFSDHFNKSSNYTESKPVFTNISQSQSLNQTSPTGKFDNVWESKIVKSNEKKYDDFKVGAKVLHTKFGVGTIISVDNLNGNISVTVNFNGFGVKQLSLAFAPLKVLK